MKICPLAGKPAPLETLVNLPRLITAYYVEVPDSSVPKQRVRKMMKGFALTNAKFVPCLGSLAAVVLGFCLASCSDNARIIRPVEYSAKNVGSWQGTVGNLRETMQMNRNGTFVCQLHQTGFLANTFSQGMPGEVTGTWNITGVIITLKITGEKHEHLKNRIATSKIESFKIDELILKSGQGETSSFRRVDAS